MIYFIQAGENGPIKIGYTDQDVESRIAQIQTGCPYELKLLWKQDGDKQIESRLHKYFKSDHIRGEWFHPCQKIKEHIWLHGNDHEVILEGNDTSALVAETPNEVRFCMSGGPVIAVDMKDKKITISLYGDECSQYEIFLDNRTAKN